MEGKETEVRSFARKFFNDNRLVIGIGLLVVLAFVVPFLKEGSGKKAGKTAMPPRPVRTATAARMDVPVYLDSFGTLSPVINVDVRSRVTGQIKDVHFESGDEVKAGDLLFSIDPQEFKAELEKAEAMLEEDIVDLKLKRDTFERNRGLFEKGLISQQDFDQYQTDVAGAEARVRLDKAGVDLAKIDLDYCCIKAPAEAPGLNPIWPIVTTFSPASAPLLIIILSPYFSPTISCRRSALFPFATAKR